MEDAEQRGVMEEPDKICVIVHGGKNLQSKKKGRCKFSVIFGVGSKKFRTDVVEDVFGSPVWNTEAEIEIDDASHPLVLTATEKEDALGQVIIPLNELPAAKPYQGKKMVLQPHKKCPDPQGEIVLSAWITAFRTPKATKSPSGAMKSLKKMKSKISHSPLLRRKSRSGDGVVYGGMKGSASLGDLAGFGRKKSNLLTVPSDSMCSMTSTDSDASSQYAASCSDVRDALKRPEVSGVSPREGPATGGTRLTIRGVNLGRDIDDIISLHICGADCTHTVEYESSSKIYVTTVPWKPGAGDIVIRTASGGYGTSLVQFVFVTDDSKVSPLPTKRMSPLVTRRTSPLQSHAKRHSFDTNLLSTSNMNTSIIEEDEKPEVSGISPKEGSTEGGTRLTIRGQNLGRNRQDVLSVTVCGQDCTDTLEYESPRKLIVTTRASKACTGEIIVETSSGGRGSSSVRFSYVEPERPPVQSLSVVQPESSPRPQQFSPSTACFDDGENLLAPEVTGLSPIEGSSAGGTRLTLRGINLGQDKSDVVGLTICGANCLPTLEYVSPMKLHCTTPPWRPGSGKIVVETRSGGVGSSLVSFTFLRAEESESSSSESTVSHDLGVGSPPSKPPRKSIGRKDSKSPFAGVDVTDYAPGAQATVTLKEPSKLNGDAQSAQPGVIVHGVCQDESTDYSIGATPYPDDMPSPANAVPRSAEGSQVPTGHTDAARPGHCTDSASPAQFHVVLPSDSSNWQASPHSRSPDLEDPELHQQSTGQEKMSSQQYEKKQPALPMSPGGDIVTHHKPPPHPREPKTSHNEGGRQVIIMTEDSCHITRQQQQQQQEIEDNVRKADQDGKKEKSKGPSFLSKITGQDKKERYIKEQQQQEREVQSGPTRQELMEEIHRVKLENRQLHEQNHMMKQYLEKLLSNVMIHCPEVLCIDSVQRPGNY